jgi:hypothetical protein
MCVVYYGILGHTHFGIDRDHKIHNNNVGAYMAMTLADWIANFQRAWATTEKPTAAVINVQYDWDAYYEDAKIILKGLNERVQRGGPFKITAYRIVRTPRGTVELRYRCSTKHTDPFLGQDGTPEGAGYIVLRHQPRGVPKRIPNSKVKHFKKVKDNLTHYEVTTTTTTTTHMYASVHTFSYYRR